MIKFLLSLLLVTASTLLGISASLKLRGRVESLGVFLESIHRMKPLISFSGFDIERVITESFDGIKGFDNFENIMKSSDLYSRWKSAVSTFVSNSKLTPADEAVLLRFGESLGVTDTDGQLMNCNLYSELISELLTDAKEEEEKKSKLYRVTGFSLGAVIALLIL